MIGSLYAAYDRILSAPVEPAPRESAPIIEAAHAPVAEPFGEDSSWPSGFSLETPLRQLTPLPSLTFSDSLAQRALALTEEQTPVPVAEPMAEPHAAMMTAPVAPIAAISEALAAPPESPALTPAFASAPVTPVASATVPAESDGLSAQAGLINRGNYVRVPIERLDSVVKLVTELIVNRATLEQNMGQFVRQLEELRGNAQRLSRVANRMEVQYEASTLGSGLQGAKAGGLTFASALNIPANGGGLKGMLAAPVIAQNNYGFDALEFDRYTEFHLLLRELTECTGDMQTMERELRAIREYFESALNRQGRLNSEMQDQLMRLRMVPLASLSSRLHRTAHQVAQQRNKQVNFIIEGEDTRLDKTVIEEMADPLLHILRNAIDHGIESAMTRQAHNKPAQGTVKLRAYHEGTQTVIQISDDGGGLNPERLVAKAIQAGVITAAEAAKLSEEEIFALIFIPGFSTATEISEISGRGVGMDIVKTTIQRLKGRIHLDSKVGAGTVCTIRLPMTLAVMRALLVKAHKQTFAIPPIGLQQIIKLTPEMIDRVGEQQVIRANNKLYPLMQLGRLLNLKRQAPPEGAQLALLMNLEDRQFAIAVDETLGGRDIVVKNLGNHIREVRGITGTTLMGDGSAVLILNLPELIRDALRPTSALAARLSGQQPVIQRPRVRPPAELRGSLGIMIVDDSLSVRRVLANRLTSVGWKAVQAKDGLDALEQLQHNPVLPDVILLDIEMPRMDGYEFLSAMRKNAAYANIPVVMITSRAGQKHRDRAFEAGANEYLVKPYQDDELLTLIRKLAREEQAQ
jgi:chemosensory pili system protein ChpA (sensor histidine kinase/response regulator)